MISKMKDVKIDCCNGFLKLVVNCSWNVYFKHYYILSVIKFKTFSIDDIYGVSLKCQFLDFWRTCAISFASARSDVERNLRFSFVKCKCRCIAFQIYYIAGTVFGQKKLVNSNFNCFSRQENSWLSF